MTDVIFMFTVYKNRWVVLTKQGLSLSCTESCELLIGHDWLTKDELSHALAPIDLSWN